MHAYHPTFAEEINARHDHLAKHQHTRIAVLPIHTVQERALYRALTKLESGHFGGPRQPNWIAVSSDWSQYCNGVDIFYKVVHSCIYVHWCDLM
jgi:hypothetical protein